MDFKINTRHFPRPLVFNPIGKRNLSKKDKDWIKKRDKKTKNSQVDHKKPVGNYKTGTIMDLRWDIANKDGSAPKHSYDYKNNLQALYDRQHKKKTLKDLKKIRKKRMIDIGYISPECKI